MSYRFEIKQYQSVNNTDYILKIKTEMVNEIQFYKHVTVLLRWTMLAFKTRVNLMLRLLFNQLRFF